MHLCRYLSAWDSHDRRTEVRHLAQMQLRFLLTAKYGSSLIDTRRTVVVSSTCPPWTARWRLRERTDCGQRCHRGHSGLHCAFRVPAPPLGTRLFHLELKRVGASWVPAQLLAALSKPTSSSSGILHKRARNCSSSSLDCIVIDAPVSRQSLASLMDMDFAVRRSLVRRSRLVSDLVHRLARLFDASFRPHLTVIALAPSLTLHLHPVG